MCSHCLSSRPFQTLGHTARYRPLSKADEKKVWSLCREALMDATYAFHLKGQGAEASARALVRPSDGVWRNQRDGL